MASEGLKQRLAPSLQNDVTDPSTRPANKRPQRSSRYDSPRQSQSLSNSPNSSTSSSNNPIINPSSAKADDPELSTSQRSSTKEPIKTTIPQRQEDQVTATWTEMQNTLEEVELSAGGGRGGSAFSAEHARALEELRKSQIALAQAWGRSEAEDEVTLGDDDGSGFKERGSVLGGGNVAAPGKGGRNRNKSELSSKSQLEAETENDIVLARQRRQANDRYFERVNKGVVDVVERLEEVARKMRGVETEAQGIWDDKDSLESDSA